MDGGAGVAVGARRGNATAWTSVAPPQRSARATNHAHAVQIAGLRQRVKHKQAMVRWMQVLIMAANAVTGLSIVGAAGGGGALVMSFRAQEPTFTGFAIFVCMALLCVFSISIRVLLARAMRSLCREIIDDNAERAVLQYVR